MKRVCAVDVKGYSVDDKGYSVDVKGYSVDVKGFVGGGEGVGSEGEAALRHRLRMIRAMLWMLRATVWMLRAMLGGAQAFGPREKPLYDTAGVLLHHRLNALLNEEELKKVRAPPPNYWSLLYPPTL
eukprot:3373858-Pyramimonas_sp.AAC.2